MTNPPKAFLSACSEIFGQKHIADSLEILFLCESETNMCLVSKQAMQMLKLGHATGEFLLFIGEMGFIHQGVARSWIWDSFSLSKYFHVILNFYTFAKFERSFPRHQWTIENFLYVTGEKRGLKKVFLSHIWLLFYRKVTL